MSIILRSSVTLLFALMLTACGGGKSGSGGGSSVYHGTETVTISAPKFPAIPPITDAFFLKAEVRGKRITFSDVDGVTYSGTITGNTFEATGQVPLGNVAPDIICRAFTLTYTGEINGRNISGNLNAKFTCTGRAGPIEFQLQGTFTLGQRTRQAVVRDSRIEMIEKVIENSQQ